MINVIADRRALLSKYQKDIFKHECHSKTAGSLAACLGIMLVLCLSHRKDEASSAIEK